MQRYSRVTFICNCAFLFTLLLRFIEMSNTVPGTHEAPLGYQPLIATLVILGYCAVFLNALLCSMLLLFFIRKKTVPVPRWLQWSSILFLGLQLLYFFGSN